MKVCLINNLFMPYERGGAEQVVKNLARAFTERGDEVIIICTKPFFAKDVKVGPYQVFYLRSWYHSLSALPYGLRYIWHICKILDFITAAQVARIIKKEKAELAIINNLVGLSGLIPAKLRSINLNTILLLHDTQWLHPAGLLFYGQENVLKKLPAKIYQSINRRRLRKIDLVISPSKWLLDLYQQQNFFAGQAVAVIPNPIVFEPAAVISQSRPDIFKILFVGQVERHKGVFLLIQAMQKIAANLGSDRRWELEVIGSGTRMAEVEVLAKNNSQLKISGAKSNTEVKQAMRAADLLIVPSLCYENYPTVIIEAILSGLPVLGASLGGIKEIIECYGGFLFNPGDGEDLSRQVLNLIKNPALLAGIKQNYNYHQKEIYDISINYIPTVLADLAEPSKKHF